MIATDPELLILDDPTLGLSGTRFPGVDDPIIQRRAHDLFSSTSWAICVADRSILVAVRRGLPHRAFQEPARKVVLEFDAARPSRRLPAGQLPISAGWSGSWLRRTGHRVLSSRSTGTALVVHSRHAAACRSEDRADGKVLAKNCVRHLAGTGPPPTRMSLLVARASASSRRFCSAATTLRGVPFVQDDF